MPFKTKRQKLAASQRRFTFADGKVSLTDIKVHKASREETSTGNSDHERSIKEDASLGRELLKITIICAIIIGIQVGLRLTLF